MLMFIFPFMLTSILGQLTYDRNNCYRIGDCIDISQHINGFQLSRLSYFFIQKKHEINYTLNEIGNKLDVRYNFTNDIVHRVIPM